MPKSSKPEKYPPHYFEILDKVTADTHNTYEIPFTSEQEAKGFRFDFYGFTSALTKAGHEMAGLGAQVTISVRGNVAVMANRLTNRYAKALESVGIGFAPPRLEVQGPAIHVQTNPITGSLDVFTPDRDPMSETLMALGFGDGTALKTKTTELKEEEGDEPHEMD